MATTRDSQAPFGLISELEWGAGFAMRRGKHDRYAICGLQQRDA